MGLGGSTESVVIRRRARVSFFGKIKQKKKRGEARKTGGKSKALKTRRWSG